MIIISPTIYKKYIMITLFAQEIIEKSSVIYNVKMKSLS